MKKLIVILMLMASPTLFGSQEIKKVAEVKTKDQQQAEERLQKKNAPRVATIMSILLSHKFPREIAQMVANYSIKTKIAPIVFTCSLNPELADTLNEAHALEMNLLQWVEKAMSTLSTNSESKITAEKAAEHHLKSFFQEVQSYEAEFAEITKQYKEFEKKVLDTKATLHKQVKNYIELAIEHGWDWPHTSETFNKVRRQKFEHNPMPLQPDQLRCTGSCKNRIFGIHPWTQFNREHDATCEHFNNKEPLTKESLMYHLCRPAAQLACPPTKRMKTGFDYDTLSYLKSYFVNLSKESKETAKNETQEMQALVDFFRSKTVIESLYYALNYLHANKKSSSYEEGCTIL